MKVLSDTVVLVFVVSSVLSIGVQLTASQIFVPLRDLRLVFLTLIANFILTPLLAITASRSFHLEESQSIALVLLGTAAGAPFLPKLVEAGKGDVALATSLMVLLMTGSLIFLPLSLPLVLPGVTVDSIGIGKSLLVTTLLPLIIGLCLKASCESTLRWLPPVLNRLSQVTLLIALVLIPTMNAAEVLGIFRSRAFIASLLFIGLAFGCGYLLSPTPSWRDTIGLATAARNIPAALLIGTQSFASGVATMVIVVAILSLIVFLPITFQIRRNHGPSS